MGYDMGTITKNLLSIHLLSSHKTIQRQKNCVETWLNGFNDYIFTTDIIEGSYNQISHTQDSNYPFSCNVKQLEEMNRIIQNKLYEKFEWFFFGDDDLVMNIDRVLELLQNEKLLIDRILLHNLRNKYYPIPVLSNLNLKYAVLGSFASLGCESSVYPSGGAGFFIHGDVFKNCKPIKIAHPAKKFVDVLVGDWMKENNIPMIWIDGMTGCDPSEAGIDPRNPDHYEEIRKTWITFHRISDFERMKLFNDIWKNKI